MDRQLMNATARAVHWIAGEAIFLGQNIIRVSYRWQQAAYRWQLATQKCNHVTTPTAVRSRWPSEDARGSSGGGL